MRYFIKPKVKNSWFTNRVTTTFQIHKTYKTMVYRNFNEEYVDVCEYVGTYYDYETAVAMCEQFNQLLEKL